MRHPILRFLVIPLLLAGCQKAVAAPASAPKVSPSPVAQPAAKRPTVGILVFEGVQIIDYAGPFEIFGQAGYDVFLVAETQAPLTTGMGQVVTPRHSFADAPPLDILVVPGGEVPPVTKAQEDPEVLAFIRRVQPQAKHVMSVCNGAFILAKTGLLDGKVITTHHGVLDPLQALVPTARVVKDQRFVDNGQIVTTAGLTSGMDGALHLLAEDLGKGVAQQVALNLEYDWRPDAGYARAKLADMVIAAALGTSRLPRLAAEKTMRIESTAGDERRWKSTFELDKQGDASTVAAWLENDLKAAGWQPAAGEKATDRHWTIRDRDGKPWSGHTTVEDAGGKVRLEIGVEVGS